MYNCFCYTIDELYYEVSRELIHGMVVNPRGLGTRELSPVALTLALPNANILMNPGRKVSKAFLGAEFLWMLLGRDDVEMPALYNKAIAKFSDDGMTLAGAYGPRIAHQFMYVYDTLTRDPNSRQAVMTIWTPSPKPSKDIPCTVMMHFLLRNGHLDLTVYMRSNDFWLGLPYDIHNFTCYQIILAKLLKVELGKYNHLVGSLHLYDDNLEACLALPRWSSSAMTPDPSFNTWRQFHADLDFVKTTEHELRTYSKEDVEKFTAPEVLNYRDPFFRQKTTWMLEKIRSKHATQHS